jgi:dephospho-CoA kinase
MKFYGITGGIGSGKSAVTKILRAMGFQVVDLDQVSRDIVCPESEALCQIIDTFGAGYLTLEGELDRRRLADLVFHDPAELAKLDAIMGPLLWAEFLRRAADLDGPFCFLDGALLFEKGMHEQLDATILVVAPEHVRMRRVVERDRVSDDHVRARMRTQMSDDEKRAKADYIVENDGTLEMLESRIHLLVAELRT